MCVYFFTVRFESYFLPRSTLLARALQRNEKVRQVDSEGVWGAFRPAAGRATPPSSETSCGALEAILLELIR